MKEILRPEYPKTNGTTRTGVKGTKSMDSLSWHGTVEKDSELGKPDEKNNK